MSDTDTDAVPSAVLRAFGAGSTAVRLEGGQGRSVRVGDRVLKPVLDEDESAWIATLLGDLVVDGFRIGRPVPALDGGWVVEGWAAYEHEVGEAEPDGRWDEVLATGGRFHAAVAHVPRPAMLDRRTHRWAVADRVAWGEAALDAVPDVAVVHTRLERLRAPVDAVAQLIHGDLSGNVLFADGLDPAVIDVSPYWRPTAYADAVVVVDAVMWWGADPSLLEVGRELPDWPQLLLRAVLFRLASLNGKAREDGPECLDQLAAFSPVVAAVEAAVRRTT